MVLKKLGDELWDEYVEVVRHLGEELAIERVVVEPPHCAPLVRPASTWCRGAAPKQARLCCHLLRKRRSIRTPTEAPAPISCAPPLLPPCPQRALGLGFVATYTEAEAPQLHSYVDFVVCLGGDGLLLHAASLFGSALPPIISFHMGSLGFLTAHA